MPVCSWIALYSASADGQVIARDFGADRTLGHQAVEDFLLRFRRVEQLLVELGAHHGARLVDLAALGRFPFLLRDLAAVDGGDAVAAAARFHTG
jgi:hypothetical protein